MRKNKIIQDYERATFKKNETADDALKYDGKKLIGRSKERYAELIHKGWDWSSFYNGWIEGRSDMLKEIKK